MAIYLLVLGAIHLRSRPLVVSGVRETAALALALAGCVLVGPAELLATPEALARFGGGVWLLVGLFYALLVILLILLAPPRLVIYNAGKGDVRAVLDRLAAESDGQGRWAGGTLVLEHLGIELRMEDFAWQAGVSLVAGGARQSHSGWRHLEQVLRSSLSEVPPPAGRRGSLLIAVGGLILALLVYRVAASPAAAAQGLRDFLSP